MVELKRPYDSQLNPWIDYIATLHGLKVSHEAAHWLKQYVGPNLAELNQEMAKVREYLGERTLVSGEDILKVVSRRQLETVFDLTKSIGCLDGPTSLIHLSRLIDAGQSEAGVVALVGRHLRILRSLKEALKDTQSPAKLAVRAGVPQFFLEEYKSQAQLWTEDKLAMATKALLETDRAIKSSPLSAHIWLENFILKTCPISRQEKDNVASRNH